jgi:hypothetical protein
MVLMIVQLFFIGMEWNRKFNGNVLCDVCIFIVLIICNFK